MSEKKVDHFYAVSEIIQRQRESEPGDNVISDTIRHLRLEDLPEYVKFLESEYGYRLNPNDGQFILERLGIKNKEFLTLYKNSLSSTNIRHLILISQSKIDQLLETYFGIAAPDQVVNDFVMDQSIKLNRKLEGRFSDSLDLIQKGAYLNGVDPVSETLSAFLKIENTYYEQHNPAIDAPFFYKLVLPVLSRITSKLGKEAFYEARERIIKVMMSHGVTPDQVSITALERRVQRRGNGSGDTRLSIDNSESTPDTSVSLDE